MEEGRVCADGTQIISYEKESYYEIVDKDVEKEQEEQKKISLKADDMEFEVDHEDKVVNEVQAELQHPVNQS